MHLIYFFYWRKFSCIIFMNKIHQNWDLKIYIWDWWRLCAIFVKVWVNDPPSWMKWNTNLKNFRGIWPTVTWPILFTLLIVILQEYRSVSIEYAIGFFLNFNVLVQRYALQIISQYTWYPRLPISAVKQFLVYFKRDKLLMLGNYLIFPFQKEKNLIEHDFFIFFFSVVFSNF